MATALVIYGGVGDVIVFLIVFLRSTSVQGGDEVVAAEQLYLVAVHHDAQLKPLVARPVEIFRNPAAAIACQRDGLAQVDGRLTLDESLCHLCFVPCPCGRVRKEVVTNAQEERGRGCPVLLIFCIEFFGSTHQKRLNRRHRHFAQLVFSRLEANGLWQIGSHNIRGGIADIADLERLVGGRIDAESALVVSHRTPSFTHIDLGEGQRLIGRGIYDACGVSLLCKGVYGTCQSQENEQKSIGEACHRFVLTYAPVADYMCLGVFYYYSVAPLVIR